MSEEKRQNPTAEEALAPQLGSDVSDIQQGKFNMLRLSKIDPIDIIVISHFLQVPPERGGNYAKKFFTNYLNLAVSVDGWRTTKIIQAIQGSKGASSVGELMKRPGWLGRNVTQRDWKRRAEEEGKTVVE